jgi:hypothetical protein
MLQSLPVSTDFLLLNSFKRIIASPKLGVTFLNMLLILRREVVTRDRLCGLVVRVPGYRSRGPGSIPGATRFSEVVRLERGPLSLVRIIEELFQGNSGSGLENRN